MDRWHTPIRRQKAVAAWSGRALAVSLALAFAQDARGDERPPPPRPLRLALAVDLTATAALAGVAMATAAFGDALLPAGCRVCDAPSGGKGGLDGAARDALARKDPGPARTASDVVGFGVAPALALSLGMLAAADRDAIGAVPVDALLIAEATSAAMAVDGMLGLGLAREKPRLSYLDAETRERTARGPDGLASLPSSHVTLAFALAASSGTIAEMRGYRLAPLVWGAGAAGAVLTAYLRIAADEAWLTDTLAGAGLGAAVGILVPYVFHRPPPERTTWITTAFAHARPFTSATVGGRVVGLSGAF